MIPTLFSDKTELLTYDYDKLREWVDGESDHSVYHENLSVPRDKGPLCVRYYKSIMLGYNHRFIDKTLQTLWTRSNIAFPLLHQWHGSPRIDTLVIINHPDDAQRICKRHVKKTPIFKSFLYDSLISTTDNDDWKAQRSTMNMAFLPILSLQKIFPKSQQRAHLCMDVLRQMSDSYTKPVNMSEFFLSETQAQLQLSMFGFSNEFQEGTNKQIRDAFSGIDVGYTDTFASHALDEMKTSQGPLSQIFDPSDDEFKQKGNMLLYAFAGHDTTGHTLTWLLYELCRHPRYKQELIQEIDAYWSRHPTETYESFHELPFMTRCLMETLRLWPALANGTYRELETEETIQGIDGQPVQIPKGTYCQIINWTRHRNPELWGSDVSTFNPHREFHDSEIWDHAGFGMYHVASDRFSPFTYGPRNCIGKNFSHMEMRLILLNLFKSYDVSLSEVQQRFLGTTPSPEVNLFTMGPKSPYTEELYGMYLHVRPRKSRL